MEKKRCPIQGVTLIELLVTLLIIAILTSVAAPNLIGLIDRWRTRKAAEEIISGFYLAKSEAIKRGGDVVISKIKDGPDCIDSGRKYVWSCGWRLIAAGSVTHEVTGDGRTWISVENGSESITIDRWGVLSTEGKSQFRIFIAPAGNGAIKEAIVELCVGMSGSIMRSSKTDSKC